MTIYLTSTGAVQQTRRGRAKPETAAMVGPGRAFSIMREPRPQYGEALDGRVLAFTPQLHELRPALEARGTEREDEAWAIYEAALRGRWEDRRHRERCVPSALGFGRHARDGDDVWQHWDGDAWTPLGKVQDGDTLACACGLEAARSGRCHRVIAADVLRLAGWDVVLDGVRV